MVVKLTYGLNSVINPANTGLQNSRVNVHFSNCVCITPADALLMMNQGDILDTRDVVIDKVVSSNDEMLTLIKVLRNIEFIKPHDEIDIYEYVNESDCNLTEAVDIRFLRRETGCPNIFTYKYSVEAESSIAKIRSIKTKSIKSKSWNIGGEILDDDYNVIPVKKQSKADFMELRNILNDVCPDITTSHYLQIMGESVKVKTDTHFSEDGDSWRDFSWYEVRLSDLEDKLSELGYLKPYLRKVRVDNFLSGVAA